LESESKIFIQSVTLLSSALVLLLTNFWESI